MNLTPIPLAIIVITDEDRRRMRRHGSVSRAPDALGTVTIHDSRITFESAIVMVDEPEQVHPRATVRAYERGRPGGGR